MERSVLPSFKAFPLSKSSAGNGVLSHVSHCERDIRVLSYNVLAQCKAKRSVYPYCHPSFLNRNHRLQATLEQIREVDAHVVCLQDADYYESWWHPQLQRLGYDGLFNSSGSFTKSGVALFYKREVFQLFQSENVNFNDVAKFLHDEKGSSRYIQNNVGVIAALQPWEDSRHPTAICVTSVCLCNPAVGDDAMLKLHDMQHQMLLRKIEEFNASFHLPVVICGTFNALPRSKNHRLMISGAYGRVVETPHVLEKRPWAEPLGRSQVKISWDRAPYCGDTPITGYVVKRRAGGNGSFQFPVHFQNGNTQSVVVCGLSSGTTYEFIVAANSYAGVGDFSQPTKPVKTQSNPRYPPRSRYLQHPEEAATLKYSHHLAKQEDWYEYEKTVNVSSEPGDFRRTGSTPRYESSQVNLDIANRTDIRNGRRMPNVVHSLQLKSLYATQKDQVENPTRITEKFAGCVDYIYFSYSTLIPLEYLPLTVVENCEGSPRFRDNRKPHARGDALDVKPKCWDDTAFIEEIDYKNNRTIRVENPEYMGKWVDRPEENLQTNRWLPNALNPSDHLPLCGTFRFNMGNLASMWS